MPKVRFVVGACGTKFGKTYGSAIAIVTNAWLEKGSTNWWVSPTYAQAEYAYGIIKSFLPKSMFLEHKADLYLSVLEPNGEERSRIHFKSADNPDNLRGYGVNFFIMDEAARCPYDSFVSLITTVTQTRGKGFIISTPKGRGWFYDMYQRGIKEAPDGSPLYSDPSEDKYPEWFSVRLPTWTNPHVEMESIEEMRRTLPEDEFRQEVAAEFLIDSAGVFRGVSECVQGSLEEPQPGKNYVMGVDLARLKDFSVIVVIDTDTNHVVYFERFNQVSWEVQYMRMILASRRYNNATVCIDSTGIGDPIVETLSKAMRVIPYKIGSSAAKKNLIEKLRVSIEKKRITFPPIPQLKRELEAYECEVTDGGVVKYSAPTGFHDDCVIALALAWNVADVPPFVYRYANVRGV